jgi:hypothetical protein
MSNDNHAADSLREAERTELEQLPRPFPWCLACGLQHAQEAHCQGCNGDHSAGYCMTDKLAAQLATVGELRARVGRAADQLFDHVLRIVRCQDGE